MSDDLPLLVSVAELRERLDDPALRVLDASVVLARPPEGGPYAVVSGRASYEAEHIPGAGFADVAGALADPDAPFPFALPTPERFAREAGALGIGDGTHVVAYAQESPMWATRLWWLLRYFGFDAVSVLDGGMGAWRAAGLPLSSEAVAHPPATFVARERPELLATRRDVEAIVGGEASACLVNALPAPVFRGEGPSSYSRPGRIPGSLSVPYGTLLDPETGRFRAPEQLRAALSHGGETDAEPVVAYCGGGISATIDVFAFALGGRDDVRLYDGSLTEWSADPALPLEVG